MIISISRRTDIPAFYSQWFWNRLKEGYVQVKNPFNPRQIKQIDLAPHNVDGLVFWTKDPAPLLPELERLQHYAFYFHFTLNGYGNDLEPNLPTQANVIERFKTLSNAIGKERVIWRYDPVIFTDTYTPYYHQEHFEALAYELAGYTKRCMISFVSPYKKTQRNMHHLNWHLPETTLKHQLAQSFVQSGKKYDIDIQSCADDKDLSSTGMTPGKCIDDDLIRHITGKKKNWRKDPNQRGNCQCIASVDIGAYNTCLHQCRYCYANMHNKQVKKTIALHNEQSSCLI